MSKRPIIFYGWIILAIAFLTISLGMAARSTFSVFYPAIVEEFGWGRGNTALMFSIVLLVYGLVSPIAGGLVDRFQPRLVFPLGVCIAGGGMALCSLAATQWHFYLIYGLIAIGVSIAGFAPFSTVISHWFFRKRGLVFGIMNAGFGSSLLIVPITQILISNFGWRTTYIIVGLFTIMLIVPLCAFFIRRSPHEKGLVPDGIPLESSESGDLGVIDGTVKTQQGMSEDHWTLARAVKTHRYWLVVLLGFCNLGLAQQTAIVHQVYFLRDFGYEPIMAANIYSVFGIMFVIGNVFGFFSDRLGRERAFLPNCVLAIGAASLLFIMKDASQPWMAFLFAALFGLGMGTMAAVFFATVADLFYGRHLGSIQGSAILGVACGGVIAAWLSGFLFDVTGSYFTSFIIIESSLVASAILMVLIAPGRDWLKA